MANIVREGMHSRPKSIGNDSSLVKAKLMRNRVYCSDALLTIKSWPDSCVDACITDPPYNIARNKRGLA